MAKVCRTCTQTMTNEYFYLEGSIFASARLLVKDVLQSCIPEMDLDLVPNSAICKNCMSALYIVYQFKTETLKNENIFRSKQCILPKNFKVVSNDLSTRGRNEGIFELLDDLDQLKTEVVYEDIDDTNEVISENADSFVEASVDENVHATTGDEVHDEDDSEIRKDFECPPLVPIAEKYPLDDDLHASEEKFQTDLQNVSEEKSAVDLTNFIQIVGNKRYRRNVNRPYKCTECNFRSDAKASLIMHRRIHTGEKPFHCTKCLYKAKRKAHLEDHMKSHTGVRPFRCTVCDKSFITKQILKKHGLIHTGEKPYRCLQCHFQTRHKVTINKHVKKVHIGIEEKAQPSVCYICGKCLSGSTSLSTHMKIHTGVKSHLCELCGRYFREKGMLKNHLRVHTGEKPFTCTECNYSATRKAHLQEHMRGHDNHRKLVQCVVCDKRYTTKALLGKHMKEHQTEVKEEPALFIGSF